MQKAKTLEMSWLLPCFAAPGFTARRMLRTIKLSEQTDWIELKITSLGANVRELPASRVLRAGYARCKWCIVSRSIAWQHKPRVGRSQPGQNTGSTDGNSVWPSSRGWLV